MSERQSKKSETLEVRLPHEQKVALMRKAHAEGRSASEVVRDSISHYLAEQRKETGLMFVSLYKPAAIAGAVGAALLWSAMDPSPLSAKPDLRAAFAQFDGNGDNVISLGEFMSRSGDRLFYQNDGPASQEQTAPVMLPLRTTAPLDERAGSPPPENVERAEFAAHDRDRDGRVTYAEFQDHQLAMMHQGFVSIDKNGNGLLDRAEYAVIAALLPDTGRPALFEELDSDGDGQVSEEEFFA